jgi:type IX secretion system PorP/SprF family membrane protein
MRLIALTILFFGGAFAIHAQQHPLYTHHIFNDYAINPAFGGSGECIEFRLGGRTQWAGFEENPFTGFLTGHAKIKPDNAYGNEWFMGIGGRIMSDQAGPFSTIRLELGWSIHLKMGKKVYGSFGFFAGFVQSQIDFNSLEINYFQNGLETGTGNSNYYAFPSVTPGFLVYGKRFFVGLSIQDIIQVSLDERNQNTTLKPHYILKGAHNFRISKRSELLPSLTFRMVEAAPVAYEIGLIYSLDDTFHLGASYRNETAISALFRVRIFDSISVGYAYDYIINDISLGATGSHELILGFNTCKLDEGRATRCAAFN